MKTHWKKLAPSNYLGSWDIEADTDVTIVSVSQEMIKPNANAPEEECVVVKYKEFDKPMIANKTNLKAISSATGSVYIEDWTGKRVTLFVKNIRAFGENVDAIRVRQNAPKPKAKPKLNDERFEKALDAIKSGKAKLSDLDKYELTNEQKSKL